jgi:hypothetical protein
MGYFTRLWAVSAIEFGLHKTSSRNKERASPLATLKLKGLLLPVAWCVHYQFPISPKKLKRRDETP